MKDDQDNKAQPSADSSINRGLAEDVKAKVRHLTDAIVCMDHRVEVELTELDQSSAEDDLKDFIRQDTLSRHSERRGFYTAILDELQDQHGRRTVAA
jgi:hypothetical protein